VNDQENVTRHKLSHHLAIPDELPSPEITVLFASTWSWHANRREETDHSHYESGDTKTMETVPLQVLSTPSQRKCSSIQSSHSIINRHKDQERVNYHCHPYDTGNNQQYLAGFVTLVDRSDDEQQRARRVPERHGCAQSLSKQTNRMSLRQVIELAKNWVDKHRYSKFSSY
jgi:hypothetical protein